MDNIDLIFLVNGNFPKNKRAFQELLPQALIYTTEDMAQGFSTLAQDIQELILERGLTYRKLSLHYIATLSYDFSLEQLKTCGQIRDYLPDFTYASDFAYFYLNEKQEGVNSCLHDLVNRDKEDLRQDADAFIFFANIDSSGRPIGLTETIHSMARAIEVAEAIDLRHRDTPFVTTAIKSLEFSKNDSQTYYHHHLLKELSRELKNLSDQVEAKRLVDEALPRLREGWEERIKQTLEQTVFQQFSTHVYQANPPQRTYTKGQSLSLKEAEELVFSGSLIRKFEELEVCAREELNASETLQVLAKPFKEDILASYTYQNGLSQGFQQLVSAYAQKVKELIAEVEKDIKNKALAVDTNLANPVTLTAEKQRFFKKTISVEEKLKKALYDRYFRLQEEQLESYYLLELLKHHQAFLQVYCSETWRFDALFEEILAELPEPVFPDLLQKDIEQGLDYSGKNFLRDLMWQPPLWESLYRSQEADETKARQEIEEKLATLIPLESCPDLEDLLTQPDVKATLPQKVIQYLNTETVYPLRFTRPLSLLGNYIFLAKTSSLRQSLENEVTASIIDLERDENRTRLLNIQVFEIPIHFIKSLYVYQENRGDS